MLTVGAMPSYDSQGIRMWSLSLAPAVTSALSQIAQNLQGTGSVSADWQHKALCNLQAPVYIIRRVPGPLAGFVLLEDSTSQKLETD